MTASKRETSKRSLKIAVIAVVLLFLVIGSVAMRLQRKVPRGVTTATLPDGTILVLRAVLFDPKSTFEVRKPTFGLVTPLSATNTILGRSHEPQIVRFAFSRHDASTGDYLDLPSFSHVEIDDLWGGCVKTSPASLFTHRHDKDGSSGFDGSLGGKKISRSTGFRILTCSMHRFETADTLSQFRVVDVHGGTVANFDLAVPESFVGKSRKGKHQSVAKTRDVTVRLQSMRVSCGSEVAFGRVSDRTYFWPEFSIHQGSMEIPQANWRFSEMKFIDFAGNELRMDGSPLPVAQPDWQLRFRLYRRQSAGFESADYEKTELCQIQLPTAATTPQPIAVDSSIANSVRLVSSGEQSLAVENGSFGGGVNESVRSDWVCSTEVNPRDYSGGGSGGGYHGGPNGWGRDARVYTTPERRDGLMVPGVSASVVATWNSKSDLTTLTTKCDHPLVVLTTNELPEGDAINIVVMDDKHRPIPVRSVVHPFKRMPIYACEVFDDSTSIQVHLVKQPGRFVELSLVPPIRGLTMSRPIPADSEMVFSTHEDQDGGVAYGGSRTSITYTLKPTATGWEVTESK